MTLNTPLHYQIIKQDSYLRMPWKNGLGETLEIQRHDDEQGLRFRISQASVKDDGVFSDFSGVHRTLVLLSGGGVQLTHSSTKDKNDQRVIHHQLNSLLDSARFTGGDETYATLNSGVIEDLNIMVREEDTLSQVQTGFAPIHFSLLSKTIFTGFYANKETILAFQDNQSSEIQTVLVPSQSLISLKQDHLNLATIQLISGSGVLIEITHHLPCSMA